MTIYTHDDVEKNLQGLLARTLSDAEDNDPDGSPGSYYDKLRDLAEQQNREQDGTPVDLK